MSKLREGEYTIRHFEKKGEVRLYVTMEPRRDEDPKRDLYTPEARELVRAERPEVSIGRTITNSQVKNYREDQLEGKWVFEVLQEEDIFLSRYALSEVKEEYYGTLFVKDLDKESE